MTGKYILDGKIPKPVSDLMEWAKWFETADRTVRKTEIGGVNVSTVFLGVDHSFEHYGKFEPILFETMIFGGKHDGHMERYRTWDEAEIGHEGAVDLVFQSQALKQHIEEYYE